MSELARSSRASRGAALRHELKVARTILWQAAVWIENDCRNVLLVDEVELQRVAVFGGVFAAGTAELVDVGV